jgi:transposase
MTLALVEDSSVSLPTESLNNQAAVIVAPLLAIRYTVAIDIANLKATGAIWHSDQTLLLKPTDFTNNRSGYEWLLAKLAEVAPYHQPSEVQIGLEATGNYWENLYQHFAQLGYRLVLLNPQQTHQWAGKRGLRAKTDKLDTLNIGKLLLSDEVRPAYVPDEQIANYRELVRMQLNLTEQMTRYKNELHALLVVLFPEFEQFFSDPSGKTALKLLLEYPCAQAFAAAGVETLTAKLKTIAPRSYGLASAQKLHELAKNSVASGRAIEARTLSLVIICGQLQALAGHLATIETQLAEWLGADAAAQRLEAVPDFGPKTVAVLRAELGEVSRFQGRDQVVASVGLDLTVRESGAWKGQPKLSKRGSGLLRKLLYMTAVSCLRRKDSPFRAYYEAMVVRGLRGRKALMAVMRKMVAVAYNLLKNKDAKYDPSKVWAAPATQEAGS